MKPILFILATLFITFILNSSVYAQQERFTVINNSGMAVTSVNISQAGQNEWGPNVIHQMSLRNNESFDFDRYSDARGCDKDVKYTTEDGKIYLLLSLNMCRSSNITLVNPGYINTNKSRDDGGGY
jgi:hypothetical protein